MRNLIFSERERERERAFTHKPPAQISRIHHMLKKYIYRDRVFCFFLYPHVDAVMKKCVAVNLGGGWGDYNGFCTRRTLPPFTSKVGV